MKFSKYNNPNKRRRRRYISRSDADIIASKALFDDTVAGVEKPLAFYDELSDKLCGQKSRNIYK